jgi:hypothetical protein
MVGASMTKCTTLASFFHKMGEKTTLFQIHDFLFRNEFKISFQCEHVDQALYRMHLTTNLTKWIVKEK